MATLEPHPILDHGNLAEFTIIIMKAIVPCTTEHNELYWYLLEIFTEYDTDKDGNVTMQSFPAIVDKVVELPIKLRVKQANLAMFQAEAAKREEHHKTLVKHQGRQQDELR